MTADIDLIQQTLLGNQRAFQLLVERYQSYVFTIVLKVLKSREVAEEVAQDVFIKVYKMLGSYQQKSKFSTWLYTISYRAALDEARKKKVYLDSIEDNDNFLQIEDNKRNTPAQDLQQADLKQQLQTAIDRLKPTDALVITLFYLHENSVQEISAITGLSLSNVKTKLHRLREKLRIELISQLQNEVKDLT